MSMSWLAEQKKQIDAEKAEREKKEAENRAACEGRHKDSQARTQREHKNKFAGLEGKMCWQEVDGQKKKLGKFHSFFDDTTIAFFAGDTKLGEINYWLREEEEYDGDGCSWGSGRYYETSSMWLYLSYTKKDGRKVEAQAGKYGGPAVSYNGCAYDDYLGEYLLNFVKL